MHDVTSDDLLGDFSHMHLGEGCFWLSVTNLVTIGYGSIVSPPPLILVPLQICKLNYVTSACIGQGE